MMRGPLRWTIFVIYLGAVLAGVAYFILVGQAVAGHADYNHRQILEGGQTIPLWSFLATSDFAVDVAENWQSEYLQFFLYILATVWLVQRGSPESKQPHEIGHESDKQQKVGRHATAEEQLTQLTDPVNWPEYVASADFWNRTLQNWQSEFLALGSMAVLSVYLRQRGSPESKPVGTAHDATETSG
jgi:hypothetical protein